MLTTQATSFTGESLPRCLVGRLLDPQLVEVQATAQTAALAAASLNFSMQNRLRPTGAGPLFPLRSATITALETGPNAASPVPNWIAIAAASQDRATSTAIWIQPCKPPAAITG